MKPRPAIAAVFAVFVLGALSGAAAARDCGWRCAQWAQYRGQDSDYDRRYRPPYLRGPGREYYGGPGERMRSLPPAVVPGRAPLPDGQIWAIAKSRVPGRIVNARLQGLVYSFRILTNRGSIVDVVVDRYSGRIVSVRGGP
ncbi:MAG TPA: hypothetical protein VIF14_02330 [Alphaproteobacteria bacterium]|jgi:hypothetical protein